MTTFAKLVTITATTLMLGTGLSLAGGIGGLNEAVAPTADDSLQDAVQASSPGDAINDAVLFDPIGGINDGVLNGAAGKRYGQAGISLVLACRTGGDDLILTNKGHAVPAGTRVTWQVRAAGQTGTFKLPDGLGVGERIRVSDVLDDGVGIGTKCIAKAI